MVVLDTDVLVGLLRDNPEARAKITSLERQEPLRTTSFTVFELLKGAQLSDSPAVAVIQVQDVLSSVQIIVFDAHAASIAGMLFAMQQRSGTPSGVVDVFIAASCIAENERIITRNKKHFAGIDGLTVETW
jgi:predicted nucleic acid-binding protein